MVARLGSVFVSLLRILSESLFEVQLFVSINVIGTFRGVRGTGVGDYVSVNRPNKVLIMGIEAPLWNVNMSCSGVEVMFSSCSCRVCC